MLKCLACDSYSFFELRKNVFMCWAAVNLSTDAENKLKIYEDNFERAYLDATTKFYSLQAAHYLDDNGVNDYMKYAQQKLDEEEKRAQKYLESSKGSRSVEKVCFATSQFQLTKLHTTCRVKHRRMNKCLNADLFLICATGSIS